MRVKAPGIAPIFRSPLQERLLGELLCRSGVSRTVSELAQALEATLSTVAREVNRLASYGYLTVTVQGRNHLVGVNWDHPQVAPLARLLDVTYGPYVYVAEALSEVPGVEDAYIFGSWAARHAGKTGPVPHDVDVVVVGTASVMEVGAALSTVSRRLLMDVQPYVVSSGEWKSSTDQFIAELKKNPLVRLSLPFAGEGQSVRGLTDAAF